MSRSSVRGGGDDMAADGRSHTIALKDHWSGPTVTTDISDVRLYLRCLVLLITIKQLVFVGLLVYWDHYGFTMFTYWNYTGLTAFYVLLTVALFVERGLLTFVTLFLLPIFLGTTLLVSVGILVIIFENSGVLDNPGVPMSLIHTGDFILHSMPLIEMLWIMGDGFVLYARAIVAGEMAKLRPGWQGVLYRAYFVLCPLVPFVVYACVFDISTHYPTGIPTYALMTGLVAINLLWMNSKFAAYTATASVAVTLYSLFQQQQQQQPPATVVVASDDTGLVDFYNETESSMAATAATTGAGTTDLLITLPPVEASGALFSAAAAASAASEPQMRKRSSAPPATKENTSRLRTVYL